MSNQVTLRPATQEDLPLLFRFFTDESVAGKFQWIGFRGEPAKELERRWHENSLLAGDECYLVVAVEDGTCTGWVNWRRVGRFGNFEMGIHLFPEHRGRGIGTEAQRLLVEYLFNTTTVHRIEALTEVDNLAEQHALERVGFSREGVRRGATFRDGAWRDSVLYGLLRTDWVGSTSSAR